MNIVYTIYKGKKKFIILFFIHPRQTLFNNC